MMNKNHITRYLMKRKTMLFVQDSNKAFGEAGVIEFVERMTTSWRDEAEWLTKLHLDVKSSWGRHRIAVVDMKRPGECGEACKTIEKTSQALMGEHDADVGEALYVVSNPKIILFCLCCV